MNYYNLLNSLNTYNFLFTLSVCIDIDNEYQKHLNSAFDFQVYGEMKFDLIMETKLDDDPMLEDHHAYFYRRLESLNFLQNIGVLNSYKCGDEPDDVLPRASVEINPDKFEELKIHLNIIYYAKYIEDHPAKSKFGGFIDSPPDPPEFVPSPTEPESNKVLYYITFNVSNEILLNDLIVLSKPNLSSENAEVFTYLIENPNKTIPKKEIEERIRRSIGKDLHKIVENLGFAGDLRKAFFSVSKDAIFFRNPIRKADFDQLGILPLKIFQK